MIGDAIDVVTNAVNESGPAHHPPDAPIAPEPHPVEALDDDEPYELLCPICLLLVVLPVL